MDSVSDNASAAGGRLPFRHRRPGRTWLRGQLELRYDRGIELRITGVRQALPILVFPKGGRPQVAPNGQILTIGTDLHQGAPLLAVARIANGSAVVVQALALHALDDDQAEPSRLQLFALALRTHRITRLAP